MLAGSVQNGKWDMWVSLTQTYICQNNKTLTYMIKLKIFGLIMAIISLAVRETTN